MIKNKIIQCFNTGARTYDQAADVQVHSAKKLAAYLTHTSANKILEIGCGTGLFSQYIVRQFPSSTILLTDISPEMLIVSHDKWRDYPNVKVLCSDGEELSCNSSHDLIVSNMAFHWFSDLSGSIKKMIDRLTSGGQIYFALLGENTLKEWREIWINEGVEHTLTFPKLEILKKEFPKMKFNIENYTQSYPNALSFLRTLKKIGGTAAYSNHYPLSAGKLRRLLRRCHSPFNVTYEIVYGNYVK